MFKTCLLAHCAFEALAFFSASLKILGAYRAHPYRLEQSSAAE
jgi:hypothetical protein